MCNVHPGRDLGAADGDILLQKTHEGWCHCVRNESAGTDTASNQGSATQQWREKFDFHLHSPRRYSCDRSSADGAAKSNQELVPRWPRPVGTCIERLAGYIRRGQHRNHQGDKVVDVDQVADTVTQTSEVTQTSG